MTMMLPAYPHLESLVDLACRDGVDIRPTLLRVLTDLYVQKPAHSAAEERHYVELARHLIDTVDEATRQTVMERLAGYSAPPKALMAPAATPITPAPVPVAQDLQSAFFEASPAERRLILTNLDIVASRHSPRPVQNIETIRELEDAALRQDKISFMRGIERALGIGGDISRQIVEDASGEPIVVVARALAMPASVLQRILLLLNPTVGQSVQRVYDLALLYDETSPVAAMHMIGIWRNPAAAAKPMHQPVYADAELQRPRRPQSPGPYKAVEREFAPLPSPFRVRGR